MESSVMRTEQWRQCILEFKSSLKCKNPFKDVNIIAKFTGPLGERITRDAYWDGEDNYKVTFAPTRVGRWKWEIRADEKTNLNGITGEIICDEYEGELDIYRHGFLRVNKSGRYLEHNDGKEFFWLGDTHWEFAYRELWNESNHPEMDSMFKGMVDRRKEQGYNVYQTNLRSDSVMGGYDKYWISVDGEELPNVEFYQNELDRRMNYIADAGIVNALGFAWFLSIGEGIERQKALARYIIARYGSLPMVWTLAGEVAGYGSNEQRERYINQWREVAEYVEKIDGYGTLQTAHYTNERPFADYYHDEKWFDFTLNQAGHGDYPVSSSHYKEFLKNNDDKPFIEGEVFYEFCSTLEENGTRICTDDMLRRVAYMSIQLGGCGYTYGAQGIWDNVLEKGLDNPMKIFNKFDITWYEAIDGDGGKQMGYMKDLYEKYEFWNQRPYVDSIESVDDNLFGNKYPLATISNDRKTVIVYYAEGARRTFELKKLNLAKYFLEWFNPRTGEYIDSDIRIEVENGVYKLPSKYSDGDWVLIIKQI